MFIQMFFICKHSPYLLAFIFFINSSFFQVSPTGATGTGSATVTNSSKVRLAFKSLALVSGNFWGTYIPGFVIYTVMFQLGYTWYDLNTRR